MLLKTRGIIFRSKKYSETSIIADIYTEARGLRSYIISGVRSKKSKVSAGLLQVMTLVDLLVYDREDKDLLRIREIKAAYIYQSIPFDIRKGAVGLFMAEVCRKTIRESEENQMLFDFLYTTFQYLDQSPHSIANLHIHFLIHLTSFLGFTPNGEWSEKTPIFDLQEGVFINTSPPHPSFLDSRQSFLLSQLLESSIENSHDISITREERQILLKKVLDFYQLHIENFPTINAHSVLEVVLS